MSTTNAASAVMAGKTPNDTKAIIGQHGVKRFTDKDQPTHSQLRLTWSTCPSVASPREWGVKVESLPDTGHHPEGGRGTHRRPILRRW